MIYTGKMEANTMVIDSTFWVAVSFFIFFGGLVYLKVPQKINEILNKLITDIKNEIETFIKGSEYFSTSDDTILSVKVDQFAASSIDIKLICFTKTTYYLEWLKVKDILALEIKSIVEKNKASFAFPSTSIYVEKN